MTGESRPRFPKEFVELLNEHKDRPNEPNIEVLKDEGFLKSLEERLDEF